MKLKAVSVIMLTLFLASMLTLAFDIQLAKSEPTTIIVPDDYEKIQWAVGNATAGDTIYVRAGTYLEHVVIAKSLNLVGENRETTIIDGDGTGNVLYVTASYSNISEFTIRNGEYGIHLIADYSINHITIKNSIITSNAHNGINGGHVGGYIHVENCTMSNNVGRSFYSHQCSYSKIIGCNVNGGAITMGHCTNAVIENVNCYNGSCLDFDNAKNSIIKNCNTYNNSNGIQVRFYASDNIITGNNIYSNNLGVLIDVYGVVNNHFYHNNFINNVVQVLDRAPAYPGAEAQIWDNGYPSGGNYWSDYTGMDENHGPKQDIPGSDGIGDTPYSIPDTTGQDNYPLMNPWGWHTLTIHSSPTGITFTVNGTLHTTPWSETYFEGTSVNLEMPATHDGYVWDHWSDTDTNRIKTVILNTDITLTAVYEPAPPPPVGGKATPINMPISNLESQVPYIALTLTIILAVSLSVAYIKYRKKQ